MAMFKIITVSVKSIFAVLLTICLFCGQSQAAYERNQAVPVEKVLYGHIESVKHVTEKQLVEDSRSGWKTFGGALIGGVIGHQFGGGSGKDVATVLGALIGGGIGSQHGNQQYYLETKLVELMIKQEDGSQVMVIQDADPGMSFTAGDEVRVVYLTGYVRVDLAM
ncbi:MULTISPECIES: glycine zipper 2TM domain-containing protein [unclassified Shewanella]|jgi:outer membrane lipoprotein SlyB|uniref:glycine zipper 2TM domain-containing protein n=2 Tax=Shewanella TaxID=22 RepID=UPI00137BFAE2|nr:MULTISPECIES: glycine zipper 2TM domain-containing protein [unclassified Shewanella]QHS13792.1 glycine zipper 2TM domain-containing protein [Shewanella sp. Arc9-LZ]